MLSGTESRASKARISGEFDISIVSQSHALSLITIVSPSELLMVSWSVVAPGEGNESCSLNRTFSDDTCSIMDCGDSHVVSSLVARLLDTSWFLLTESSSFFNESRSRSSDWSVFSYWADSLFSRSRWLISSLSPIRRILRFVRASRSCRNGVNCTTCSEKAVLAASGASILRRDRGRGVERRRWRRLGLRINGSSSARSSKEDRNMAGVRPVEWAEPCCRPGPGSEKRTFLL